MLYNVLWNVVLVWPGLNWHLNLLQKEFHIYFVFMSSYFKCNFYLLFVMMLSLGLMFFFKSIPTRYRAFLFLALIIWPALGAVLRVDLNWVELIWTLTFKKALCVNEIWNGACARSHMDSTDINRHPSARRNQKQEIYRIGSMVVGKKMVSLQNLFSFWGEA